MSLRGRVVGSWFFATSVVSMAAPLLAQDGDIMVETTGFELSNGDDFEFELGTLYVPENRNDPDSRDIEVGFVRLKSFQPSPSAPPIFQLPGGPGSSYLSRLLSDDVRGREQFARDFDRLRAISDVVLVDQRGFSEVGEKLMSTYSQPARPAGLQQTAEESIAEYIQFARDAVRQYEDTEVDLAGYTVKECAHDVAALANELGYDQITLLATSFGSQWSFAIMRLHPDIVARALLSGVEPLDHAYDMPSHVYAAVQRMWAFIDQDPRFEPYLPEGGMAEVVEKVMETLTHHPPELHATHPETKEKVPVKLTLADFPYRDPDLILEMYHGRWDRFARLPAAQPADTIEMRLIGPLIDSSLGVTPERRTRLWSDPAAVFIGRDNFASYLASADIWPSPDVGDEFRTPIQCEIPVVFAQGNWDLSTPIENTYEIAPYFPNSRTLVTDRGGHGVIGTIARQSRIGWMGIEKFLRTGDMSEVPSWVRVRPSRQFPLPSFAPPEQ